MSKLALAYLVLATFGLIGLLFVAVVFPILLIALAGCAVFEWALDTATLGIRR